MYVKAILPSNVVYYKMSVLPHSIRLSDNEPLDASGNVLQHETCMVSFGDLMSGAHALISELQETPFPQELETTETKSDY